jgi:hypothetical protein
MGADPSGTAKSHEGLPAKGLTLIGDANGRPLKRAALSALDAGRDQASRACRRAVCARLAEGRDAPAGRESDATANQIASISGHKTLKEVERYTKAADQKKMAD